MRVRTQTFVAVKRSLALLGALALGTAVAMAQAPANQDASSDQAEQKNAASATDSQKQESSQAQKSQAQSDAPNASSQKGNQSQRDQAADRPATQDRATENQRDRAADSQAEPRRTNRQPAEADSDPRQPSRSERDRRTPRDPADGADVRRDDRRNRQGREGEAEGERQRGSRLGFQLDRQVTDGIVVGEVEANSGAAQAGLRSGDRIVSVDGRELVNPRQFRAYMGGLYGRPVPIIIDRGGQRYTVQLPPMDAQDSGPWLGVYLQDNEQDQQGATITNVFPSGPAARAGLRRGDVVLQLNGQQVAGTPDLIAMIDEFQPQERVEFLVRRGDQEIQVPAVLGSRENFVFHRQGGMEFDSEDEFAGIPPHAMGLEHDRRMAEQHQRIESELIKLQDEVRQLRELLSQQRQN